MSDFTTHASVIANKADQEATRKQVGGYRFPIGTVLASVCVDGVECAVIPFIPNESKSGPEQYSEWHDLHVTSPLEGLIKNKRAKK